MVKTVKNGINNSINNGTQSGRGIDDIVRSGFRLLVIIINRGDGDETMKYLSKQHFHMLFSCMAEGTQGSEILDLLGLGSVHKTVLFCVSTGARIRALIPYVSDRLNLKKAGRGIAFTVPLLGLCLPMTLSHRLDLLNDKQKLFESEVDRMNGDIKYSMILTVVDQGNSEEVVETARAAGAKGGTVINARGTGVAESADFFGLHVQAEKELILIITKRENKQKIMESLNRSFGFNTPSQGLIMSLPVDEIIGANV